jgi:hypothetical protein
VLAGSCLCGTGTDVSEGLFADELAVLEDSLEQVFARSAFADRGEPRGVADEFHPSGLGALARVGDRILHGILPAALVFGCRALEGELAGIAIYLLE